MGEAMPQASQSWSRPDDDDRDSLPADAAQVAAWLDWAVEEARLSEEVHVAAIAVLARAGAAKYYEDAVPFQETLLTSLKTRVASLKAREEPGMLQHAEKERLSKRLRGIGAACAKFGFARGPVSLTQQPHVAFMDPAVYPVLDRLAAAAGLTFTEASAGVSSCFSVSSCRRHWRIGVRSGAKGLLTPRAKRFESSPLRRSPEPMQSAATRPCGRTTARTTFCGGRTR